MATIDGKELLLRCGFRQLSPKASCKRSATLQPSCDRRLFGLDGCRPAGKIHRGYRPRQPVYVPYHLTGANEDVGWAVIPHARTIFQRGLGAKIFVGSLSLVHNSFQNLYLTANLLISNL